MNGIQEVRGSIPLISTKLQKKHKTSIRVSDARFWFSFDPLLVGHRGGFYCFYRRNWELITKQPGGLPTAAILPVALCRCFWHVSLQCWQSPNRRPLCYLRPQPRISHLLPIWLCATDDIDALLVGKTARRKYLHSSEWKIICTHAQLSLLSNGRAVASVIVVGAKPANKAIVVYPLNRRQAFDLIQPPSPSRSSHS